MSHQLVDVDVRRAILVGPRADGADASLPEADRTESAGSAATAPAHAHWNERWAGTCGSERGGRCGCSGESDDHRIKHDESVYPVDPIRQTHTRCAAVARSRAGMPLLRAALGRDLGLPLTQTLDFVPPGTGNLDV